MPQEMVCDCPYVFAGGDCVANDPAPFSCMDCAVYKRSLKG